MLKKLRSNSMGRNLVPWMSRKRRKSLSDTETVILNEDELRISASNTTEATGGKKPRDEDVNKSTLNDEDELHCDLTLETSNVPDLGDVVGTTDSMAMASCATGVDDTCKNSRNEAQTVGFEESLNQNKDFAEEVLSENGDGKNQSSEDDQVEQPAEDDENEDGDYRLDDDDFDLLDENLGFKVKRRKFRRVVPMVDSDEDENVPRTALKKKSTNLNPTLTDICDVDDGSEEELLDLEGSDAENEAILDAEDSDDDFIVDDNNEAVGAKRRVFNKPEYTQVDIDAARDIFGIDVNLEDLKNIHSDSEVDSDDEDDSRMRRNMTTVDALFEPAVLEAAGLTTEDLNKVSTDEPERFQPPRMSLPRTGSNFNDEVFWIFEQAFASRYNEEKISTPDEDEDNWDTEPDPTIPSESINNAKNECLRKLKKILELIRDDRYEVPYIYFYYKDLTRPEFTLEDLWRIYELGTECCRFFQRKKRVCLLISNMMAYQAHVGQQVHDELIRPITKIELTRVEKVRVCCDLDDILQHFLLYYAEDIFKMKEWIASREAEVASFLNPEDGEECRKKIGFLRGRKYSLCRVLGIGKMLHLFGLTPEQFGENFAAGKCIHETQQSDQELDKVLQEYTHEKLTDTNQTAVAASFMLATQMSRDFNLRKTLRQIFMAEAKISVTPTKEGLDEIDENHPVYPILFLKEKPNTEMDGLDFLHLVEAESYRFLTIAIGAYIPARNNPEESLVVEAMRLFQCTEEDTRSIEWNKFRGRVVEYAFENLLYMEFRSELRRNLLSRGRKLVLKICMDSIYKIIRDGPLRVTYEKKSDDDDDWDTSLGLRVVSVAYMDDSPIYLTALDRFGLVEKSINVTYAMTRFGAMRKRTEKDLENDAITIRNFIEEVKPHVIIIGGESRSATNVADEMRIIISSFSDTENLRMIPVYIIDNKVPKIYSRTNLAMTQFPKTPEVFRQAVSLGRLVQDPLLETAQLCNKDDDILSLFMHKYQNKLSEDEIKRALEIEFISRSCETGVDINLAIRHPHKSATLQFISGFGPAKAAALLRKIRAGQGMLHSRRELVEMYGMEVVIYKNSAGFIKVKLDIESSDDDEIHIDARDMTRIPPEYYYHALLVAQAAVSDDDDEEVDVDDLDENEAREVVSKVITQPTFRANLRSINIEQYVELLESLGHGNMSLLFDDIINELEEPYADVRRPFQIPSAQDLFYILSNEPLDSIYEHKLLYATVIDAVRKRPPDHHYDEAMPMMGKETGSWGCRFCLRSDFKQIEDVWQHYDNPESCLGAVWALRINFHNGITGSILYSDISDSVLDPGAVMNYTTMKSSLHVRILRVNVEKFFLECTSKTSDLQNPNYMPERDRYFDHDEAKKRLEILWKKHNPVRNSFVKRQIFHPCFKNFAYIDAEKELQHMDQGDVIFRPSSKNPDQLVLTWKVVPNVYQHVTIKEKDKERFASIGNRLLIGTEEFEDLDEIMARFVNPQACLAREVTHFKYYHSEELDKEQAYKVLEEKREAYPNRTHYILSPSQKYPGVFQLSYLPNSNLYQEPMTLTPGGIYFRKAYFGSINGCIDYWKSGFPAKVQMTNVELVKSEQ